MKLVILESPYAGDVVRNVLYARACIRDALLKGYAPIASHLLYTQPGVLNDDIPDERTHGIEAGLAWRSVAEGSLVYTDRGISRGMEYGIAAMKAEGKFVIECQLAPEVLADIEAQVERLHEAKTTLSELWAQLPSPTGSFFPQFVN